MLVIEAIQPELLPVEKSFDLPLTMHKNTFRLKKAALFPLSIFEAFILFLPNDDHVRSFF